MNLKFWLLICSITSLFLIATIVVALWSAPASITTENYTVLNNIWNNITSTGCIKQADWIYTVSYLIRSDMPDNMNITGIAIACTNYIGTTMWIMLSVFQSIHYNHNDNLTIRGIKLDSLKQYIGPVPMVGDTLHFGLRISDSQTNQVLGVISTEVPITEEYSQPA